MISKTKICKHFSESANKQAAKIWPKFRIFQFNFKAEFSFKFFLFFKDN